MLPFNEKDTFFQTAWGLSVSGNVNLLVRLEFTSDSYRSGSCWTNVRVRT